MAEHDFSTRKPAEPTVRRAERGGAFAAEHQGVLARLIEEPWRLQSDAATRMADLSRRAYEPIRRIVEDSAAKEAWVQFRDHRLAELTQRLSAPHARTFGGAGVSLIPKLHAGVNVFATPYDFQVNGPTQGEVSSSPNRLTGTFEILLGWGHGGARFATAGVGLTLEAAVQGTAHVRPAWRYEYQAIAEGQWLGSHTDGAGRVVVQDAITGAVLKEQMWPLWNFDNDRWEDQDGYVDSWALGLDFFVQAGQLFHVSFLATAMVADSGTDYLFGWSLARAWMEMRVPFVVVEL